MKRTEAHYAAGEAVVAQAFPRLPQPLHRAYLGALGLPLLVRDGGRDYAPARAWVRAAADVLLNRKTAA